MFVLKHPKNLPIRQGGNITITCGDFNVTKNIPLTGKVSLELQGLSFGVYDVSAILSSDNYLTVQNSTQFKVSNYNTPQWSNEGYDSHNTGKSPYETNSNGAIIWKGRAQNIHADDPVSGQGLTHGIHSKHWS